jgi:hypothetical protein
MTLAVPGTQASQTPPLADFRALLEEQPRMTLSQADFMMDD